ncbi:hypothetical protein [Micromonospora echinospora]|uniref:hypothetical protein n=1 Tax=Micromonospora echinospora TaxID=1877 RepID=UPI00366D22C1
MTSLHSGRRPERCSPHTNPFQRAGGRLHRALLADRPETRATLLVEPDNEFARGAYSRWGYRPIGELRPGWEHSPTYLAMLSTTL